MIRAVKIAGVAAALLVHDLPGRTVDDPRYGKFYIPSGMEGCTPPVCWKPGDHDQAMRWFAPGVTGPVIGTASTPHQTFQQPPPVAALSVPARLRLSDARADLERALGHTSKARDTGERAELQQALAALNSARNTLTQAEGAPR